MTDSDFNYTEASAKRKKRNQLISIVIVVAILLVGAIVWGWIELEKRRNAERIKSALTSQMETSFPESPTRFEDPYIESIPQETPEPNKPSLQGPPPSPQATPTPRSEYSPPIEKAPPPAPKAEVTPVPTPRAEATPVPNQPPAPKAPEPPKTVEKAESTPTVQPEKLAMTSPEPSKPPPVFQPEDLPMPAAPEISEDARAKLKSAPESAPKPGTEGVGTPAFAMGVAAYRQNDFHNAVKLFANIPKPTTKQRGNPERDEYVKANYFRGLSLQQTGRLSEAAAAYNTVLEYERYHPVASMNQGICYVELKQYAKAHRAFEAVVRDQSFIEPELFDDVMQRTRYFWALAWTRMYRSSTDPDKQKFYQQQAVLKWKDYLVWYSSNDKFKQDNVKAENYLKSLGTT